MKVLQVLIPSLFLLTSCTTSNKEVAENSIVIEGEVTFATEGYIVFSKLNPRSLRVIDTIPLANNKFFTYRAKIDTPDFYHLDFFGKQKVNLILDDDDIKLVVDGNDRFGKGRIYGSTEHDMLWDLKLLRDSLSNTSRYINLKKTLREAYRANDPVRIDSLKNESLLWVKDRNSHFRDFLSSYEVSLAHIEASRLLTDSASLDYVKDIANELVQRYPTSKMANKFYKDNLN